MDAFTTYRGGCPNCHTAVPPASQRMFLLDGGSIQCPVCETAYHMCAGGKMRMGHTPLDCPYCNSADDMGEYIGNYKIGPSSRKQEGGGGIALPYSRVGSFYIGRRNDPGRDAEF